MVARRYNETAEPANTHLFTTKENGIALSTQRSPSQPTFKELAAKTTINQFFKPRWYQQKAVDSIFTYFEEKKGNPLIVVPTGAGKSHILGMFCKRVLDQWPDQKILILTHVDTIIRQDFLAIREHLPAGKVGIYSAGVGKKERRSVTVAGIQSIASKARFFQKTTIILIDEAHTVPPVGEGRYRSFLAELNCPIIGLTATHFRLRSGYLHEGAGRIFTDIAYEVDIVKLIDQGYLCKLIPKDPLKHIDLAGVKTVAGDFNKKDLHVAVSKEGLTEAIISDLITYKERYKKWLLFATDIAHSEDIRAMLEEAGVSARVVHSKQAKGLNEDLKSEFKHADSFQALVSVESLTTGFDVPSIDLIALLRPTKSPVLHIQMIGRGLRIHPNKEHCLVLDFAGNVSRLGPINDVHIINKRKKKGGVAITKICPECQTICAGAVRWCPTCNYEFTFETKLKDTASNKDIITKKKKRVLKKDRPPEWHNVDAMLYTEHFTLAGNPMLLASYKCGKRTFFEYKDFDLNNRGYQYSLFWWRYRGKTRGAEVPTSTREAVIRADGGELRAPIKILVSEQRKQPEIKEFTF